MDAKRLATLRSVVATFVPADARVERVTELAARAIDGLTPRRRRELQRLLDLLWLPMKADDARRASVLSVLANSPVEKLRAGFAALKRLALFLAYAESERRQSKIRPGRASAIPVRETMRARARRLCRCGLRVRVTACARTLPLSAAARAEASLRRRLRAAANASSSSKPAARSTRPPLRSAS